MVRPRTRRGKDCTHSDCTVGRRPAVLFFAQVKERPARSDQNEGVFAMTSRTTSSSRRAFTLIELITVVAVLGIVAVAVGGPTLGYMDSVRARAASARTAADIRFAQRTAMASGLRTWVVFSTGAQSYQIFIENSANPGKAGRVPLVRPYDQSSASVDYGTGPFANVSLIGVDVHGGTEIEFDSWGKPYDTAGAPLAATGVISLSNGVVIRVHPVGGCVERTG